MDQQVAEVLRRPFPADRVGKLPRVTCKACSESRDRHCGRHQRTKCTDCGGYVTTAHIHLDYVGHADTTDRLLEADPAWDWEPWALGPDGLPLFDRNGGLWIRLTIAGVTRPGYGDAQGKTGPNAVKEAVGDAIRNAAMRFGVALDLWRKEPPEPPGGAAADGRPPRPTSTEADQRAQADEGDPWAHPAARPAAAETATSWFDHLESAIGAAATVEEARQLWQQLKDTVAAERVDAKDAAVLEQALKDRAGELQTEAAVHLVQRELGGEVA